MVDEYAHHLISSLFRGLARNLLRSGRAERMRSPEVQEKQHSHDSNEPPAGLPVEQAATLRRRRPPAAIRCRSTVIHILKG